MFQLFQLRCFVAVATELHFGKAAERLNMTQPPLTRQIQLLEEEIGTRLLERNRRGARLTAAGRVFLAEAEFLIRRSEAAAVAARRAAEGSSGTLVLGFVPAASYYWLPNIVKRVRRDYPGLELVLQELSSDDQLDALEGRRIDLGVIRRRVPRPHLHLQRILCEPMILAMPDSHPLAANAEVELGALHEQAFVMYAPTTGRYFHEMLMDMFHTTGVAPQFVQYVPQDHTILSLVSAGLGLALVPRSAAQLQFPSVVFKPIELPAFVSSELYAAYRTDNEEPVTQRILELVSQSDLN